VSVEMERVTIAVIISVYNRVELTKKCIGDLLTQNGAEEEFILSIYIVDDDSTDGTREFLEGLGAEVNVIQGDGSWFWAKSMAIAESRAIESFPDYILWLNDDVQLAPNAIETLLRTERTRNECNVVVGALLDPRTQLTSYGGRMKSGRHPLAFVTAGVSSETTYVDAFHGNVVLVSRCVSERVGTIDGSYAHAFADDDYSLRCGYASIPIVQAPGYIGICEGRDPIRPDSLRSRIMFLRDPKGLPIGSLRRFLVKHRPSTWPLYLCKTVFRILFVPKKYWSKSI